MNRPRSMDEIKRIIRSFIICTLPTTKTEWVAQLLQSLNYVLDFSGFDSRQGQEFFFNKRSIPVLESTQHPLHWYQGLFLRDKEAGA